MVAQERGLLEITFFLFTRLQILSSKIDDYNFLFQQLLPIAIDFLLYILLFSAYFYVNLWSERFKIHWFSGVQAGKLIEYF